MPVIRGKDKRGYYYRYGDNGKRYYYRKGHPSSRTRAKNKAKRQGYAIKARQGAGLGDVYNWLLPIRQGFPPSVRKLIEQYSNAPIKEIWVARRPLKKRATMILNAVTLGQLSEEMKKMRYDELFHLFMFLVLNDGTILRFEKEQVIRLAVVGREDLNSIKEKIPVPVTHPVTFGQLVKNTVEAIGNSLYLYDGQTNNCQVFLINVLKANGLLTPEAQRFISQDIVELFSHLPATTPTIMNFVTDLGARWDRLIEGEGLHGNY